MVSGEWIISAPERAKRPHEMASGRKKRKPVPISKCPFEDFEESGNGPILLRLPESGRWRVSVIPNKFPALRQHDNCPVAVKHGLYEAMEGVGYHELVIPREHDKNLAHLPNGSLRECFRAITQRVKYFDQDPCVKYVSVFHAWGSTAGGSVYHPHIQMVAMPIVPPGIERSMAGSKRYFETHGKCAHCVMLKYEGEYGKRLIYENEHAVVLSPYAARQPYEIRIFPKKHYPSIENTPAETLDGVADALKIALGRIEKRLFDPDYNFFIHSAPSRDVDAQNHYHWHIEILPRLSIIAGLEWSTGVDVNIVDPDEAAKVLR